MNWTSIITIILNIIYIGVSAYAVQNPELAYLAPIITALATITRTPQSSVVGAPDTLGNLTGK